MQMKMRAMDVNGHRYGVRLDDITWRAIDYICAVRGIKWPQWAKEKLDQYPDADNMTAVLRYEALKEIFEELAEIKKK